MIRYHPELVQGTDEWRAARCGLLTASEMHLIVTPTLKIAANDKERSHLYELLAQRVTQYVEPSYISDDMLRGHADEVEARILYDKHYNPVTDMGFITNDRWGFTLGYSPDGLVNDDGLMECKSRRQKYQIQTVIECDGVVAPSEYMLQLQTALLVSEREWIDFISYSGGLPMVVVRVFPDARVQKAIIDAATAFEERLAVNLKKFNDTLAAHKYLPTERRIEQEMHL